MSSATHCRAWRFFVLEHYRGEAFRIPGHEDPGLAGYWRWYNFCPCDTVSRYAVVIIRCVGACCSICRYESILALPAMQQSLDVLAEEGQRVHGPGDAKEVYVRHVKK